MLTDQYAKKMLDNKGTLLRTSRVHFNADMTRMQICADLFMCRKDPDAEFNCTDVTIKRIYHYTVVTLKQV